MTDPRMAAAQADPDLGFIVDAPHAGAPLILTFGHASWETLNRFDFDGRTRKLALGAGQPINRILVRDTANLWYQHGVAGLGLGVDDTAAALAARIAPLRPAALSTVGQSMGAYAAILFGVLLGADRVLAFGPLSSLCARQARRDGDTRWLAVLDRLERFPPPRLYGDLPALLAARARRPAVHVVIGMAAEPAGQPPNLDALHGARLAAVAGVSLETFDEAPHAVAAWLVAQGRLDALLQRHLLPTGAARVSPPKEPRMPNFARIDAYPAAAAAPPTGWQPFTDDWRAWIFENLALGSTPEALLPVLEAHGLPPAEAQREIDKAARSPYLAPARRLSQRLAKREWVLAVQRRTRELAPRDTPTADGAIERRHRLPRDEFLNDYYAAGRPVVITGRMDDWPALHWTPQALAARFADRQVQVQTRRSANRHYEMQAPQHRETVRFGDFMHQVIHGGPSNDIYMTANNASANAGTMPELWQDIVQIPEYLDGSDPASHGFFFIGPAGTVTPTHHDLTNNFMAQVLGRKRVRLVDRLHAARVHNDIGVFSDVDLENIDEERFPAMREVPVRCCDLAPGELLFIPVGWWHHVRALDISVTVTFTNFVFDNEFSSIYPGHRAG